MRSTTAKHTTAKHTTAKYTTAKYTAAKFGHTLMELMIAVSTLMIVVAMSLSGWSFVIRGERRNSTQAELDMQVRGAIERLRADLRISCADKLVCFPTGPGPYEAFSFPLALDSDGDGLVDMLPGDEFIDWQQTVAYHVAKGNPDRLLRTTFSPRDNSMSQEAREEQLAKVVADGHGDNAGGEGELATTKVMFSNFFDWVIDPKSLVQDAYNPVVARRSILFGTALLGPGDHDYGFTVLGKNDKSSGYKLGLDSLRVSPSPSFDSEAEDQTIVEGADNATRQYMPQGSWGGNHHLLYDLDGPDEDKPLVLRLPCDRWEERNFRSATSHERTKVVYDEAEAYYALELAGKGDAWYALDQTGSEMQPADANEVIFADTNSVDVVVGCAVRMLVQGDTEDALGYLLHDGRIIGSNAALASSDQFRSGFYFRVPTDVTFSETASVAVAVPGSSTLDAVAGTASPLRLRRWGSTDLVVGLLTGSDSPFAINHTNSYVVSILFNAVTNQVALPVSPNVRSAGTMTAFLAGASEADLSVSSWTSAVTHQDLYSLEKLVTAYPENGIYTSQIVDTTIQQADYGKLLVEKAQPSETEAKVRLRVGELPDLSDAGDWQLFASGGSLNALGDGRFVQFQVEMTPDGKGEKSPQVSCVSIDWPGQTRLVDVAGVITVGPDYGMFEVEVDGRPLVKGLRIKLAIFKDVQGTPSRLTSAMTMEVEPRNTGR